jgi:hypothetical protein
VETRQAGRGQSECPAVIHELRHEVAGLIEVNPEGGKVARANAVSPQVAISTKMKLPNNGFCATPRAFSLHSRLRMHETPNPKFLDRKIVLDGLE